MRRLFVLGLLGATSLAAMAQSSGNLDGPAGLRADFQKLDRSRDGYISKIEANGDVEIAKRFAYFDMNGDGRLSEREYILAKEDNQKRTLHDATITARVKAALVAQRGIPPTSIAVDTYEGRVQLSGFVGKPEIASKAGRVTASVDGVRTVDNKIAVK